MKNRSEPPENQNKTTDYSYIPAITTVAMPFLFGKRKKLQTTAESPQEKPLKPAPKPKSLKVAKYEVSENDLKFFDAKGFPKKRWVLIKEIPIREITGVDSLGNELTINWNGAAYSFVFKKKSESFSALRDQIQGLLEQQQKTLETSDKSALVKSDLAGLVNGSIGIVDSSFDILMGLHERRVNWSSLEGIVDKLGSGGNFTGQTLAPLNLDFARVSAAIKKQAPKETARETFSILKLIYQYFDGLKPDANEKEKVDLNLQNAKAGIVAYYTLNDLLLGKVVGEKDSEKEIYAFEGVLSGLAKESNVKVSFEDLRAKMDGLSGQIDDGSVVEQARGIFKEQLKLL